MPTNPHYEAVKKAVIKECPGLLQLSFGCKIELAPNETAIWYKFDYPREFPDGPNFNYLIKPDGVSRLVTNSDISKYKIIGHPIRLSHILMTLFAKDSGFELKNNRGDGMFLVSITDFATGESLCWDLYNDDLEKQDQSVWEALDKMLSV